MLDISFFFPLPPLTTPPHTHTHEHVNNSQGFSCLSFFFFYFFFQKCLSFFLSRDCETKLLLQKFHKQKKGKKKKEKKKGGGRAPFKHKHIEIWDKDVQLHCPNLIAELSGAGGGR